LFAVLIGVRFVGPPVFVFPPPHPFLPLSGHTKRLLLLLILFKAGFLFLPYSSNSHPRPRPSLHTNLSPFSAPLPMSFGRLYFYIHSTVSFLHSLTLARRTTNKNHDELPFHFNQILKYLFHFLRCSADQFYFKHPFSGPRP